MKLDTGREVRTRDEGMDEIISPASYAPSFLFGKAIDYIDS
jgi:hypothetical protein